MTSGRSNGNAPAFHLTCKRRDFEHGEKSIRLVSFWGPSEWQSFTGRAQAPYLDRKGLVAFVLADAEGHETRVEAGDLFLDLRPHERRRAEKSETPPPETTSNDAAADDFGGGVDDGDTPF